MKNNLRSLFIRSFISAAASSLRGNGPAAAADLIKEFKAETKNDFIILEYCEELLRRLKSFENKPGDLNRFNNVLLYLYKLVWIIGRIEKHTFNSGRVAYSRPIPKQIETPKEYKEIVAAFAVENEKILKRVFYDR